MTQTIASIPYFDLEHVVPGIDLDPIELENAYQQYLDRVPDAPSGLPEDRFRKLGLTHRPGAADPWRDAGVGQFDQASGEKRYEEQEFSVFNEALKDSYFHHLYRSLTFRVGRIRLVALEPSEIYHMHTDASRVAHVAIRTNDDSRFLYRAGTTHHVPVDGRIHVFNTLRHHSAYNAGATVRIHLTMTLVD